jgi:hypothetical protein
MTTETIVTILAELRDARAKAQAEGRLEAELAFLHAIEIMQRAQLAAIAERAERAKAFHARLIGGES